MSWRQLSEVRKVLQGCRRIEGATRSNSESECIIWDSIVDTVKNRATLRDAPHIYFTSVWGTDRTHMKKTMKNKHFWVAWYMGPGCTLQRSAWANDWATKMQPKVMPPEMSCQEGSVPRHQAETAGCWVPWDHTPSNCTQAAIPGSAKILRALGKLRAMVAVWLIVDASLWKGWELNGAEWSWLPELQLACVPTCCIRSHQEAYRAVPSKWSAGHFARHHGLLGPQARPRGNILQLRDLSPWRQRKTQAQNRQILVRALFPIKGIKVKLPSIVELPFA